MAMQYQVIITDHVDVRRNGDDAGFKSRRVKTGYINVASRAEAEQVADLLQNRTGLTAEPVLKMWQPGGGSVTLDFLAVERIATEFIDGGGKSEGKPAFARAAE
jgi:hypothetical protein